MDSLAQLLPLVLIFALFWFLILRPARKKQQAATALRSSLAVGDTVLLGSGIYGRIDALEEDGRELRLEIAPGVVVRAHRDAVVSREPAAGSHDDSTDNPAERPTDTTEERPEERPGGSQPT